MGKITNFEYITNNVDMLADFLAKELDCTVCFLKKECLFNTRKCRPTIRDWLESEVEQEC